MRASLLAGLLFIVAACGGTSLQATGSGGTLALGPGGEGRSLASFTDLETVRGVAVVGETLFAATDGGLFAHPLHGGSPGRAVEGLPLDVRGVIAEEDGLFVATAGGFFRAVGEEVSALEGVPAIGEVRALDRTSDGVLWACGAEGVLRGDAEGWRVFGEIEGCTTLASTPEGQLWIGTTTGLLYVEGEVVREHPLGGGMPEAHVRSVLPVMPGQILALLQGPSRSVLGFWNGTHWFGYTIDGFGGPVVGLARRGSEVLLVGAERVVALAPTGAGVGLVPVHREEGNVRSYRAQTASEVSRDPARARRSVALREASVLREVPERGPSVDAPPFRARPVEVADMRRVYAAFTAGDEVILATGNAGLLRLPERGAVRRLRTQSLVPARPLAIADIPRGGSWLLARGGVPARFSRGRFERGPELPEELRPQALASGERGAVLVLLAEDGALHLWLDEGSGFRAWLVRQPEVGTRVTAAPIAGVALDGKVWIIVKVERTDGGDRLRGAIVVDPESEALVYHHREASREAGGLPLPDEVDDLSFDAEGNTWLATLSGLVRMDAHQAVVFGERRGVRGEIVSGVAAGGGAVWVASGEGVGRYDPPRFDYAQPDFVQSARPTRLAFDGSNQLWAVGSRGLFRRVGNEWSQLGEAEGLPPVTLLDVASDAAGRVWLLAEDRLVVLER